MPASSQTRQVPDFVPRKNAGSWIIAEDVLIALGHDPAPLATQRAHEMIGRITEETSVGFAVAAITCHLVGHSLTTLPEGAPIPTVVWADAKRQANQLAHRVFLDGQGPAGYRETQCIEWAMRMMRLAEEALPSRRPTADQPRPRASAMVAYAD